VQNREGQSRFGRKLPHKRKPWRTTIWKQSGIRYQGERLLLSRAKGLPPIFPLLFSLHQNLTSWKPPRPIALLRKRVARHGSHVRLHQAALAQAFGS
jgi:hypothetical protein